MPHQSSDIFVSCRIKTLITLPVSSSTCAVWQLPPHCPQQFCHPSPTAAAPNNDQPKEKKSEASSLTATALHLINEPHNRRHPAPSTHIIVRFGPCVHLQRDTHHRRKLLYSRTAARSTADQSTEAAVSGLVWSVLQRSPAGSHFLRPSCCPTKQGHGIIPRRLTHTTHGLPSHCSSQGSHKGSKREENKHRTH